MVCHVKDAVVTDSGKTYNVDLPKMFASQRPAGRFKGYFVMEWDGRPGENRYAGTDRLVHETVRIVS